MLKSDRFKLETPLEEGDLGTLWRGNDPSSGAPLAVSILDSDAPEQVRKLLETSAEALTAAKQASLPKVHTVQEDDDGGLSVAFEWIDGVSLGERLAKRPSLTVTELIRVVTEILDGLERVHAEGAAHGEVGPSRIVLSGRTERPRLVGFGLNHASFRGGLAETEDAGILASVAFASPEQARGESFAAVSDDLWSIAVVIYSAFTSSAPFTGSTLAELREAVGRAELAPIASVRPELKGALAETIDRALAKEKDKRYPDAAALRKALRASLLVWGRGALVRVGQQSSVVLPKAVSREVPAPAKALGAKPGGISEAAEPKTPAKAADAKPATPAKAAEPKTATPEKAADAKPASTPVEIAKKDAVRPAAASKTDVAKAGATATRATEAKGEPPSAKAPERTEAGPKPEAAKPVTPTPVAKDASAKEASGAGANAAASAKPATKDTAAKPASAKDASPKGATAKDTTAKAAMSAGAKSATAPAAKTPPPSATGEAGAGEEPESRSSFEEIDASELESIRPPRPSVEELDANELEPMRESRASIELDSSELEVVRPSDFPEAPPSDRPKRPSNRPKRPSDRPKRSSDRPKRPSDRPKPPSDRPKPPSDRPRSLSRPPPPKSLPPRSERSVRPPSIPPLEAAPRKRSLLVPITVFAVAVAIVLVAIWQLVPSEPDPTETDPTETDVVADTRDPQPDPPVAEPREPTPEPNPVPEVPPEPEPEPVAPRMIAFEGAPPGAQFFVDGRRADPAAIEIPPEGTTRRLEVRARGFETFRGELTASSARVALDLEPLEERPTQVAETRPTTMRTTMVTMTATMDTSMATMRPTIVTNPGF